MAMDLATWPGVSTWEERLLLLVVSAALFGEKTQRVPAPAERTDGLLELLQALLLTMTCTGGRLPCTFCFLANCVVCKPLAACF